MKFSFPNFYYSNLSDITNFVTGDHPTDAHNVLRGERYKGYSTSGTFRYRYIDFEFDSTIQYDHCIISRADILEDYATLSYIRTMYLVGASPYADVTMSAPLTYSDLYNQDVILIKPDKTVNTSNKYRFIADYTATATREINFSKVQFSEFFEFDYNPSEWSYTTKSNQMRFNTDLATEISVEIDYPRRVFSGTWEAISDVQLDTFKTRVQQQMTDNQYAYCYLYDDSGRDELLGSALCHVKITDFKYTKDSKNDGTPYNIVQVEMEEVRG